MKFNSKVLRRKFGLMRDTVIIKLRKLHGKEFHDFYALNVIKPTNSKDKK
jgi:hypothetical protein